MRVNLFKKSCLLYTRLAVLGDLSELGIFMFVNIVVVCRIKYIMCMFQNSTVEKYLFFFILLLFFYYVLLC